MKISRIHTVLLLLLFALLLCTSHALSRHRDHLENRTPLTATTVAPRPVFDSADTPSRPAAPPAATDSPPTDLTAENQFHICHTSQTLEPASKYFVRIENKEGHSVYVQLFSKSEGEEIYRIHPASSFERWIDSPGSKTTKISVATRQGEECGNVRIVLWNYEHYLNTMLGVFVVALVLVCAVSILCCTCVCLLRKARKNALQLNEEPSRYQKMNDHGEYLQTRFPGVIVATEESDEEVVPFSSLTKAAVDHQEHGSEDLTSVSSMTAQSPHSLTSGSSHSKRDSSSSKKVNLEY
uniref:Uncharacterized protein n=1 Tax=Percolomonas cosmopolitus TaxID=63605 RepID=A0A7S1PJ89_9EUKA|mmetsp:Transcript_9666/g.35867  ORF Transcript_9666/g.35867 Transcript_9666/m.35867 type:complete len:295 (+) Transcript_9666:181-1065(+)